MTFSDDVFYLKIERPDHVDPVAGFNEQNKNEYCIFKQINADFKHT